MSHERKVEMQGNSQEAPIDWSSGRSPRQHRFRDRRSAGRELAEWLLAYEGSGALVLGLPRGGVVVAGEVAARLGCELDVFAARKLGAPSQPELGIGAVAPGGVVYLDQTTLRELEVAPETLSNLVRQEEQELERRMALYRGDRPAPTIVARTVIVVDDGLATGVTASAAVKALQLLGAGRIILAVPVAASQSIAALRSMVDEVVACETTSRLVAVGLWYEDFEQITDEEVIEILYENWSACDPPGH